MSVPSLRRHLVKLLQGGQAHLSFDQIVKGIPKNLRAVRPQGSPHSLWQLLEHMRIAQWDILEFSRNPNHQSPPFPEGYWPASAEPSRESDWDQSIEMFQADLQAMVDLVADPDSDLFLPFPHGSGQTLLREALLVADHNAYHLGQMVVVRRLLGTWQNDDLRP